MLPVDKATPLSLGAGSYLLSVTGTAVKSVVPKHIYRFDFGSAGPRARNLRALRRWPGHRWLRGFAPPPRSLSRRRAIKPHAGVLAGAGTPVCIPATGRGTRSRVAPSGAAGPRGVGAVLGEVVEQGCVAHAGLAAELPHRFLALARLAGGPGFTSSARCRPARPSGSRPRGRRGRGPTGARS